jgi:hypothetical protein
MPGPEQRYLDALAKRVGDLLGPDLVGVYAGGSWALGDYEPGRSDLDVAVVTRSPTPSGRRAELAEALGHAAFPCPARGLELVLYPLETVQAASAEPGFDLNFNTGAGMDERVDFEPVAEEAHWFAIDRSILAQHGVALSGPEAATIFESLPRERMLPLLAEALRWHARGDARLDDAVLNACRSLHFAAEGVWVSKRAAAGWMLDRANDRELVSAALAARERRHVPLDPALVQGFLARALDRLNAG